MDRDEPVVFSVTGPLELLGLSVLRTDATTYQITLTWRDRDEQSVRCLICDGVASLTTEMGLGGADFVSHLQVRDISARQWERIRFAVSDEERLEFSWLCAGYRIETR